MEELSVGEETDYQVEVAKRFYLWNESRVEIGKALGISRFRVARLLERARESGLVQIKVNGVSERFSRLEIELSRHLALRDAVVVASSENVDLERQNLAEGAARYLKLIVEKDQTIGMSWGRTLLPVPSYLTDLPSMTFVQLTGVVGSDASQSPIEIISRIRARSDVQTRALIAPLYASSAESAETLKKEPSVAEVMELHNHLDVALLSVGSWQPRVTQLAALFDNKISAELDAKGVYADFGGLFFDAYGNYVDAEINKRRISVSVDQLAHTSTVIAVAGGAEKTQAIRAVCHTGLPTCLVTTDSVAQELLAMPAVEDPVWTRAGTGR